MDLGWDSEIQRFENPGAGKQKIVYGNVAARQEHLKMKKRISLPNTLTSLPGWVIPQWVRRGHKMHGPYYYHFHRVGGKLRKRYIPKSELSRYRELCAR